MNVNLDFINLDLLNDMIKDLIDTYEENLEPYNLEKFNSNLIDPFKIAFEHIIYDRKIEEVINLEIIRQREKNIQNKIGELHQRIFSIVKNCTVPNEIWDVIYTSESGEKIFVELKNKYNTMNSSSSAKTFLKMLEKVNQDETYSCYLVEVISNKSKFENWELSIDKKQVSHDRIKRVSIDKFYEKITNDQSAFLNLCKKIIKLTKNNIITKDNFKLIYQQDTVNEELSALNKDPLKALFQLGFKYPGFENFED